MDWNLEMTVAMFICTMWVQLTEIYHIFLETEKMYPFSYKILDVDLFYPVGIYSKIPKG